MSRDIDGGDVILLSIAAIAGILAILGTIPASIDLIELILDAVKQTAPYNGPIEAGLAVVALLSGTVAFGRRTFGQ